MDQGVSIDGITICDLAPFLAEVARATSIETAKKLSNAWGGTNRVIPKNPKVTSQITSIIGIDDAVKVCRLRGGERIDIPMFPMHKNKKSIILSLSGSTREVAMKSGSTERYVRMVRGKYGK